MYLQDVALSLVKPGNDNNFIADRNAVKSLCYRRIHFEPGVGRAFTALLGGFFALFEWRTNDADRIK
jgi:hypothetical protein